jgi:hypothetical protein
MEPCSFAMETVSRCLAGLSSYATLQRLYERYLKTGRCLTSLQACSEEFTPSETAEFGRFKTSRFGKRGHFEKYCALRKAEVLEIPFPHVASRKKGWLSGLTCTECLLKNHPSETDCAACIESLQPPLVGHSSKTSFANDC